MGIEDFIPSYSANEFGYDLARLKEFWDLKLTSKHVAPPAKGEPFPYQLFVERFFAPETQNEVGLLAMAPGTGKTCAATIVAEHWKRVRNGDVPRGKTLVLAKGGLLLDNFIKEIYNQCTKGEYSVVLTKEERELSPDELKKKIQKEVSKYYEFHTFRKFFLGKKDTMTAAKARASYSNRTIIIDEIHLVKPKTEKAQDKHLYSKMHEFLHAVEGCRKLGLTGTPIWDQASQIADVLNLFLPLDMQLLRGSQFNKFYLDENGDLTSRGRKELGAAFRGKVFVVRAENSNVKKMTIGVTAPYTKHLKIYPSVMSEIQSNAVKIAEKLVSAGKKGVAGGVAHSLARSAATCIIPIQMKGGGYDYQYGNDAFERACGRTIEKTVRMKNGKPKRTNVKVYALPLYLRDLYREHLAEFSSKYAVIVRKILKHPDQVFFVFTELALGSGAINLGLILELYGLRRASSSVGVSTLSKERRFTILSSIEGAVTSVTETSAILEYHNRPDNWSADRLQVIIGTEKLSVGITIKHVRQFHCVVPPWNVPSLLQAESRAIRFGSHLFIPPEQREIKLYNHAAVYPPGFSDEPSVDIWAYRVAEEKDYQAAGIYRLMKENDVGCATNYLRNVLEGDEDYSPETNYREKNYVCADFPAENIDTSGKVWDYIVPDAELDTRNYNYLYSSKQKNNYIEKIKTVFRTTRKMVYEDLARAVGVTEKEEPIFIQALSDIVDYRYPITDRLGFSTHLEENDNVFFLASQDREGDVFEEKRSLVSIVETSEIEKDLGHLRQYLTPTSANLGKLSYIMRVVVIEDLFRRSLTEKLSPGLQKIVDTNKVNFYRISKGWAYNFYAEKPASSGYATSVNKIVASDLHFLPDGADRWIHVEDPEIVRQVSIARAVATAPDPNRLSGIIDDRGFTISEGKRQGRNCSSWNTKNLLRMFEKLDYLPPATQLYPGLRREDLLSRYENFKNENFMRKLDGTPEDEPPFRDVRSMSREELCQVLSVLAAPRKQLCKWLEEYFIENGMIVS